MRLFKRRTQVPDGLFIKCEGCGKAVYRKVVVEKLNVCPECDHHFRIGFEDRIRIHLDPGSFEERDASILPCDPLEFVAGKSYADQIAADQEKTGIKEAAVIGRGRIEGRPVAFGILDFAFRGGSMGSVVGEKITRLVELAVAESLPLVTISASGGARMQESALSLMQMAKTCAALTRLHEARLPYLSVMTDPTTGGVTASWASMGDVILAEPGATIGFAGRRVIEQTIRKRLPDEFQTAEFMLEHGFVDAVVPRGELRTVLAQLIDYLTAPA
jgi:acetyl-CoA carboxylase carboxyl transferase subunit beta